MKTRILLVVIFTIILFGACVRYNKSSNTVTKSIILENIEEGWKYENNEWYYYDRQVSFSPVIYCSIETIDSTSVFNLSKKNHKMKVHTQSTGFYETSEPGWNWDDKGWSYRGNPVKSFPPSFTRKITQTVVTDDLIKDKIKKKRTIIIVDFYQVKDQRWTWGTEENCWLLDDSITGLLPPYGAIKFTKIEKTSPNFSIKMNYSKKQ